MTTADRPEHSSAHACGVLTSPPSSTVNPFLAGPDWAAGSDADPLRNDSDHGSDGTDQAIGVAGFEVR
jgi:hypothetical protein